MIFNRKVAIYIAIRRYQGEQNGANPGSYLNKSGYACLLPALDDSWRRAFNEGSSTNPEFPIGVVSLHGVTSQAPPPRPPRRPAHPYHNLISRQVCKRLLVWLQWCGEEEAECSLDPDTRTDNTARIRWARNYTSSAHHNSNPRDVSH